MPNLLALSPNLTVDIILSVPVLQPGGVVRTTYVKRVAGGKGINVARTIRQLGYSVEVAGFLGGHNGHFLDQSFAADSLVGHYVWVDGDSRESILISEPGGRSTVINEQGPSLTAENVRALAQCVQDAPGPYDWVSLSGSIPPGAPIAAYAAVVEAMRRGKVAIDTHGDLLKLVARQALDLLRINQHEASDLLGYTVNSPDTARNACKDLYQWGNRRIAISLGEQGAVGYDGLGCWHVSPPPITLVSDIGAGDSMFAGMLAALMSGQSFAEALRQGTASGAAACTNQEPGTLPVDTYRALLSAVTIKALD